MNNKKILAAVIMLVLSGVSSAHQSGLYVGVMGGLALTPEIGGVSYNNGFDFGAALGMKRGHLRFEGAFDWQRSNAKTAGLDHTRVYAFMFNGHYDFDEFSGKWVPSIGTGIGMANVKTTASAGGGSADDNVFAFQVMANLNYHFNRDLTGSIGYKYFITSKVKSALGRSWQNHVFSLGLTYHIG